MPRRAKLDDQVFEMKFSARQFERMAKKADSERKKAERQVATAIRAGHKDRAQIYAQTAIRHKTEHLQFIRLSARIDAVASQLQTAAMMDTMTRDMKGMTRSLDKALKTMDVEQVSKVMAKFEDQFEELGVRGEFVNSAMNQQSVGATPQDDVDSLIMQVADEHQIEMAEELGVAPRAAPAAGQRAAAPADDLEARFNALQ